MGKKKGQPKTNQPAQSSSQSSDNAGSVPSSTQQMPAPQQMPSRVQGLPSQTGIASSPSEPLSSKMTVSSGMSQEPRITAPSGMPHQSSMAAPADMPYQPRMTAPSGKRHQPKMTAPSGMPHQPRMTGSSGMSDQPRMTASSGMPHQPRMTAPSGMPEKSRQVGPSGMPSQQQPIPQQAMAQQQVKTAWGRGLPQTVASSTVQVPVAQITTKLEQVSIAASDQQAGNIVEEVAKSEPQQKGRRKNKNKKEVQQASSSVQELKSTSSAPVGISAQPTVQPITESAQTQVIREKLSSTSISSQKAKLVAKPHPESAEASIKTSGMELPVRKNKFQGGTLGRKIQIRTNFMPLNLKNIYKTAIHYDISFDPEKPKRFLKIAFDAFCLKYFPNRYPAFDGVKNVYAAKPLPNVDLDQLQGEISITNPDNGLERVYKIAIKFASHVDLSSLSKYMDHGTSIDAPQKALQCIDIVFRHALSRKFIQVGKSFFSPPTGTVYQLSGGMALWHGLFSSCILGWKPYLNVDVANKGFPIKQLVTEYMHNEVGMDLNRPVDLRQIDNVRKFIKSLKVTYLIPGKPTSKRSYRVNDIQNISAEEETFEDDKKKKISVVKYYKEAKGYVIKYPKLPCLWVGSKTKKVYIPPELCTIDDTQVVIKKLNENQTRNMIRATATSTEEREQKIMTVYDNGNIGTHPAVREFNLSIDSRFENVDARVLQPPKLLYAGNKIITPRDGVWRTENEKFLLSAKIQNWTVLNLDGRTNPSAINKFCAEIEKFANKAGILMNSPRPPTSIDFRNLRQKLPDYFEKAKNLKLELVFVIIPHDDIYSKVKQTAELQYGILTQCIKSSTLFKLNPSTCNNILLKVNAKLNGTNYEMLNNVQKRPFLLSKPVMIAGADVTHPSPDQTDIPSVVGVAASHDPNAFKYNMVWRLQSPKAEIIEDLQSIMREHLIKFYKATAYKPQAIYFYRDGVSEGQFKQVLNSEFSAIRRACQSLEENYKPPITMLVVQKRHHTRFFPSPQDAIGKNKNVPPGTVVDKCITHPTERDFYLVSHQSIQGVARPTKYKVLWDDNDLTEDQLQELTYFLCHMFSRCTRAVSYPTPTYYAHLAAYRGRIYIEGKKIQLDNLVHEQNNHRIKAEVQQEKPMFFV